jgi:hypothetical protein
MSVYIRVELQRQIRNRFGECCAYCRTAEFLTAMTFEFSNTVSPSHLRDFMVVLLIFRQCSFTEK